jgi:hypothetical protein
MDREQLEQLIMQDVCVPEYFSNYTDPAVLLSVIEDAPSDIPLQDYLNDNGFEECEVWEPFCDWEADTLMNQMNALAGSIIDLLVTHDLITHISLRKPCS